MAEYYSAIKVKYQIFVRLKIKSRTLLSDGRGQNTTVKDVSIKVDQVFKTLFDDAISSYHQSVIDCVYSLIILRMFCANILRLYHIHDTLPFYFVFHPRYTSNKSFNALSFENITSKMYFSTYRST